MGYYINANILFQIRSFADAERYYNDTPVIRGQDKDDVGVPLRLDRIAWRAYSLRKLDGGDAYGVVLYASTVVVWRRDGVIELDFSYDSNTTQGVVNEYSPAGVAVHSRGVISLSPTCVPNSYIERVLNSGGNSNDALLFAVGGVCKIIPVKSTGKIKLDRTPSVYRKVLDLKKAARLRDKARPFVQYVTTMAAISPARGIRAGFNTILREGATEYFKDKDKWGDYWQQIQVQLLYSSGGAHIIQESAWYLPAIKKLIYSHLYGAHERYCKREERAPFGQLLQGWYTKKGDR